MRKTLLSLFALLLTTFPIDALASQEEVLDKFTEYFQEKLEQFDSPEDKVDVGSAYMVALEVLHKLALAATVDQARKIFGIRIDFPYYKEIRFPSPIRDPVVEHFSSSGYSFIYNEIMKEVFDTTIKAANDGALGQALHLLNLLGFTTQEQILSMYFEALDEAMKRFMQDGENVVLHALDLYLNPNK